MSTRYNITKEYDFDVVILGGGSAGFGAVYRLLKNGVKTAVVDRNADFGGTAVFAGVSTWEPGISSYGVHSKLAEILTSIPDAGGCARSIMQQNVFSLGKNNSVELKDENFEFWKFPIGLSVIDNSISYEETLSRCQKLSNTKKQRRFQFEGSEMSKVMNMCLEENKQHLTTFFQCEFVNCITNERSIKSIIIRKEDSFIKLNAKIFVDASGDVVLCKYYLRNKPLILI